jgi:hypothetical protein
MLAVFLSCAIAGTPAVAASAEPPLVGGPGVPPEKLDAFAEAQGRLTLSRQLDVFRPSPDIEGQLRKLTERAQAAWLSGSMESSRNSFREIAALALEADWREPQREAIQYAFLRLAQSAPSPLERESWISKAIETFPDLLPDSDLFPPPLLENFSNAKQRLLKSAREYRAAEHFPGYRLLLVNGKRFELGAETRIRLPEATFRVTALSDYYPPVTEKLKTSQLFVFRVAMAPLAGGDCGSPTGEALDKSITKRIGVDSFMAVYDTDCARLRGQQGWLPQEATMLGDSENRSSKPGLLSLQPNLPLPFGEAPARPEPLLTKKSWVWIGVSVLVVGAAVALTRDRGRASPTEVTTAVAPEPVHREGL